MYKIEFVQSELQALLKTAYPSIHKVEYMEISKGEYITVTMINGHKYTLNVSGSSLMGIASEVTGFMKHR